MFVMVCMWGGLLIVLWCIWFVDFNDIMFIGIRCFKFLMKKNLLKRNV